VGGVPGRARGRLRVTSRVRWRCRGGCVLSVPELHLDRAQSQFVTVESLLMLVLSVGSQERLVDDVCDQIYCITVTASLASAFNVMASMSGVISGSSWLGGCGASRTCWYATLTDESPMKGGRPTSL